MVQKTTHVAASPAIGSLETLILVKSKRDEEDPSPSEDHLTPTEPHNILTAFYHGGKQLVHSASSKPVHPIFNVWLFKKCSRKASTIWSRVYLTLNKYLQ